MDLEPIEERANEFATWVGKFDSAERVYAAFASAADVPALLAEVERLRAEVARLAARPAPAWDEEAVRAASQALYERLTRIPEFARLDSHVQSDYSNTLARAVLAVVRDHQPVKPGREDMVEAMLGSDIITDDLRAEASAQGSTQREPFLCFADAILDLWPGRSEVDDAL